MPPQGRPPRVPDEELVATIREQMSLDNPVVTTAEVTAAVDLSQRAVQNRLRDLHEGDEIAAKTVGARGRVWWIPEQLTRLT